MARPETKGEIAEEKAPSHPAHHAVAPPGAARGREGLTGGLRLQSAGEVLEKVREELSELEAEIKTGNESGVEKEWGDLVFSLVNLGRHLKLDSEGTAHKAIDNFIERFGFIEDKAEANGKQLAELTTEEMNELWEEVKQERA